MIVPSISRPFLAQRLSKQLSLAPSKANLSTLRRTTSSSLQSHHNTTATTTTLKKTFTTSTATMSPSNPSISSSAFQSHLNNRRTNYALNKDTTPLSAGQIDTIVQDALQSVPSSFNTQTTRVVTLHGPHHDKFWDFVLEVLKSIVPAEQFEKATAPRIAGFRAGAGTVLFFEDQEAIAAAQGQFAIYADKFPLWATQSDAMLQYAVWTALEADGLGANLQHYNPLVDDKVVAEWALPESWKLNAQLVFGGAAAPPGDKTTLPVEQKFKSFGA